jgi:hypothetical protein
VARVRARKGRGCFSRLVVLQCGFGEPSLAIVATTWVWRRWATCSGRQPMAQGGSPASECGEAAWHRPRPLVRVISLRCTVATTLASDRGVFRHLGVRVRSRYGSGRCGVQGCDVAREHALWHQTISSSHLPLNFSPKFQTQVHKSLNTKVAQQLTLYKIAKGSRGVFITGFSTNCNAR